MVRLRVLDPCDVPFEGMRGLGRVRRCGECARDVHDLTRMSDEEAIGYALLRSERSICARLGAAAISVAVAACAPPPPTRATSSVIPTVPTSVAHHLPLVSVDGNMGMIVLPKVRFDRDRETPTAESKALIANVVAALRLGHSNPIVVEVHGYASPDEKAAQRLSEARAIGVASELVKAGVPRSCVVTRGHVASVPEDDATDAGPEEARRVEFKLSDGTDANCVLPFP